MNTQIVTPTTDRCKTFNPDLSSRLDQAHQEEEEHTTAAIEHFVAWKRHMQAASDARAQRRALEALLPAEGLVAA